MTKNLDCNYTSVGSDIIAQQLFLGSSIASFNSTRGWDNESSSLAVELVDDVYGGCNNITLDPIFKLKGQGNYSLDNHYYSCMGNSCYIDEKGFDYDPNRSETRPDGSNVPQPSKEKVVPGKLYHVNGPDNLFSRYWIYSDPGFFGQRTRIAPNGTFNAQTNPTPESLYRYDLIGVPAYFRFGFYTFGGIITDWVANERTSLSKYTVTLSSAQTILKNCKVIISKYAGSVFTKFGAGDYVGSPTNYTGFGGNYRGLLKEGNLANVFNVYGFLESYGFGTAKANEQGIPLAYVLDSLSVLTSVKSDTNSDIFQENLSQIFPNNVVGSYSNTNRLGYHSAFSPFGRILCKTLMTDDKINPIPMTNFDLSFGIMDSVKDQFGVSRTEFLLDLSEIPRPPLDVHFDGIEGISDISAIITAACEKSGRSWYSTIIRKNGLNYIKIKTIDRTRSIPTNTLESVVKSLETASPSIPVTQSQFGKSLNKEATPRVMYIGANQQRLYQTKSYLLGYSNTHLVYHPILKKFVDYYRLCKNTSDTNDSASSPLVSSTNRNEKTQNNILNINIDEKWTNSYRLPMAYSVRNIELSNIINGRIVTELFANEQALASTTPGAVSSNNTIFESLDKYATDSPIGGSAIVRLGNYWYTVTDSYCSLDWFRDTNRTEQLLPEECRDSTNKPITDDPLLPLDRTPRYIPLWYSSICPFFGYANDQLIPTNDLAGSNIYRFIRPVYLDTWNGLLTVGFRCNELPLLHYGMLPVFYARRMAVNSSAPSSSGIGSGAHPAGPAAAAVLPPVAVTPIIVPAVSLTDIITAAEDALSDPLGSLRNIYQSGSSVVNSVYSKLQNALPKNNPIDSNPYGNSLNDTICFVVTETEFRAACAGWENYLAYCLMKMPYSKPDLFTMLIEQYRSNGQLFVNPLGSGTAPGGSPGIQSGTDPGGPADVGGGSSVDHILGKKRRAIDVLNMNFNWVLNQNFIEDWKRITTFVSSIGSAYYGKQYLIAMPEVLCYRDQQYADIQLPVMTDTSLTMSVYQGSGKIYFNYNVCDYAWEEFGNYIDDSIVVGSPDYYKLCNNKGQIPALIGYNANPVKDYVAEKWCSATAVDKLEIWKKSNVPSADRYNELLKKSDDKSQDEDMRNAWKWAAKKLEASILGRSLYDCSTVMVPSLDLQNSSNDPYVLVMGKDSGREDAFGNRTIGTPIILQDGDKILDPTSDIPLYKVDLKLEFADKNLTPIKGKTSEIGKKIPIPTLKTYFVASVNPDFIFLDPLSLRGPRALLTAPGQGLNLYFPSLSYTEDPSATVIANVAAEDLGILENMAKKAVTFGEKKEFSNYISKICENLIWLSTGTIIGPGNTEIDISGNDVTDSCYCYQNLRKVLIGLLSILDDENFLIFEDQTTNQSGRYYAICPRKANPFYAAVPLVDNMSVYGPWTNYPMIADSRVYPGYTAAARSTLVEQLINDTDVQKQSDWCPWNYGGMSFLDREIINQIDSKASYATILENGILTTHGMPIFDMSGSLIPRQLEYDNYFLGYGMFLYYIYGIVYSNLFINYAGLVLSNISVSVSENSITSVYKFDTYTPRLGLFNKEISDRNKLLATTRIQFANQISTAVRNVSQQLVGQFYQILKENSSPRNLEIGDGSRIRTKIYDTSPIQYLVGSASYLISSKGLPVCGDPGLNNDTYKKLRSINPSNKKNQSEYLHNIGRTKNWIGAFVQRESLAELASQYSSKALMSLDGIFSPVSFYPTYNLGTYPISSRCITESDRSKNVKCNVCSGTGITSRYIESIETKFPCPACNRPKLNVKFTQDQSDLNLETPPDINFLTLNPIIVPNGEFQNINSQILINPLERLRHNISVVGRQELPIDGDRSLDINNNLNIIVDKDTKATNYDYIDKEKKIDAQNMHNADFYEYDLSYNSDFGNVLLNQRFFAFRGPMMLHGWGYDTEGFPVPNQADQPKDFDSEGRPKRFVLTSSGTNDLTKEGKFLPANTQEFLGDIIGSGYVMENGEWTRKPTRYFHVNWGERSDLWPIGPIDLRWDRDRQVWVGAGGGGCEEIDPPFIMASGSDPALLNNFMSKSQSETTSNKKCPYKMVYVVLEENLFSEINMSETYPARGFIDDTEYGLEPMPYGVRRLVYIKDRSCYSAPRGSKLLCRYNRDTNFYEPISKPSYIVFGSIVGGSNTAIVELTYVKGIKAAENVPKINIVFDNTRFDFNINASKSKRGMFLFENGKWILTGFN